MNALEIKNLTKAFPGFTLDHLSLTLPSGCILGLIGENGAGKSTTMEMRMSVVLPILCVVVAGIYTLSWYLAIMFFSKREVV